MILRSAAAAAAAAQTRTAETFGSPFCVNDFVELRSDDPAAKPWLAKIVGTRREGTSQLRNVDEHIMGLPVGAVDDGYLEEVECEWLWHPKDSIRDLNLVDIDPSFYGSREVFMGSDSGDATHDWNPLESVKWRVFVFPLEKYKAVAAAGFQISPADLGPGRAQEEAPVLVEPNRCWYYRQALDVENRTVTPALEPVIHRANPAFLDWCKTAGLNPQVDSHKLFEEGQSPLASFGSPPPRTLVVPENPERVYFACCGCARRFETRHGDCSQEPFLDDGKTPLRNKKSHINQPDVEFLCPMCASAGKSPPVPLGVASTRTAETNDTIMSSAPRRLRGSLGAAQGTESVDLVGDSNTDESGTSAGVSWKEEKRKNTRHERFASVFEKSINEAQRFFGMRGEGNQPEKLLYSDAKVLHCQLDLITNAFRPAAIQKPSYLSMRDVLCDSFFHAFEQYATDSQLSAKMAHQKLHEIFQNLKRENNDTLRRRIVTGELPLMDLLRMDAKDLAPESLKRKREVEAQKYFKQQVLLSSSAATQKVFRKTHKGLEAVEDDDEAGLSRSPTPGEGLKKDSTMTPFYAESGEHNRPAQECPFPIRPSHSEDARLSGSALFHRNAAALAVHVRAMLTKRRSTGPNTDPLEKSLFELPLPVVHPSQRVALEHFCNTAQLLKPPLWCGIPSAEETRIHILLPRLKPLESSLSTNTR